MQTFVVASALAHAGDAREEGHDELFAIPNLQMLASRLAAGANGQFTVLDPLGNTTATSLEAALPNQRNQPDGYGAQTSAGSVELSAGSCSTNWPRRAGAEANPC